MSPSPRPLFSLFMACAAVGPLPAIAQATTESVLGKIYESYSGANTCWITRAPGGSQKYCMKLDRSDRIVVEGVTRIYLLTSGRAVDDAGKDDGGHASPGLVGAFVAEEHGQTIRMLAADAHMTFGAFGRAPAKWKLVRLGPADYWGWLNTAGDCHQGYCASQYIVLAPYGKGIRDLAGFPAAADSSGACGDKQCEAKSLKLNSRLEIDASRTGEKVFPLIVTVSGKAAGREVPAKNWAIPFDSKTWKYQPPRNWPLKDAAF